MPDTTESLPSRRIGDLEGGLSFLERQQLESAQATVRSLLLHAKVDDPGRSERGRELTCAFGYWAVAWRTQDGRRSRQTVETVFPWPPHQHREFLLTR
jgi:hypothetical protein